MNMIRRAIKSGVFSVFMLKLIAPVRIFETRNVIRPVYLESMITQNEKTSLSFIIISLTDLIDNSAGF
jgi:hypothetical protein